MTAARSPIRKPSYIAQWLLLAAAFAALSACKSWGQRDQTLATGSATQVLEACQVSLDGENMQRASECYKRLIARFPFGPESEQAQLRLAYSQGKLGDFEEATATVNRFIKTYPTHANVDYAFYLRGLISYERTNSLFDRITPQDRPLRDQGTNKQAFLDFSEMLKRFPDSEFAPDARARMLALRAILADSELSVAKYYLRRGAYIGALNRAKFIVESYQGTPQSLDALAIMVQCYEKLSQNELAEETRTVLKTNAPQHAFLTGKGSKDGWWPF